MTRRLTGKVAIVTGASKGIGAAIARRLAGDGAAVVVNYASSKADADRVVADITRDGGKAVAVQADLSREPDVRRLFAETHSAFGRVDVLVNNAGTYDFVPLDNVTAAHFRTIFDLNVLGLILASQEAAKRFGDKGGSIINISSVAASSAMAAASVYSASKAAVDAVTRSLGQELGPRNIRVNSINPGMVDTEGVRTLGIAEGDFRKNVESRTPLGRIGQPQDVAPAVSFLASDDASWITGETLYISGGFR